MKKILTIIGARPQIIKAAAVSRAIRTKFSGQLDEVILHTGQHYDTKMSDVFFEELQIPRPHHQLDVGSGNHGEQTAKMLAGIESVLTAESIDALLVYGDTNSTLAGALAAAKLHIPVIHVEAGLRSFNKAMPEEINRITCDHCSTLLFSPTQTGMANLKREGFDVNRSAPFSIDHPGVFYCGDVMYDNSLHFSDVASSTIQRAQFGLKDGAFALVTIHRPYNTDDIQRLNSILTDLSWFSNQHRIQLVVPLHPRTKHKLEAANSVAFDQFQSNEFIHVIEPVSFLEMTYLEKNCELIVTDSGGVQKEAYFFEKSSVVIRTETEWKELVAHGSAHLAFQTGAELRAAFEKAFLEKIDHFPPLFGDGKAAEFMCDVIAKNL